MIKALLRDGRSSRYWRVVWANTSGAVAAGATVGGLYDVLFPDQLPQLGWLLGGSVLLAAVGFGLFRARPRPIAHSFSSPNVTIRIVRGDLFDEPGHLAINMNDTFDTAVDSGVIAATSTQAQFLSRIYGGDVDRLDGDLADALRSHPAKEVVQKAGKTARYELGTVATLGTSVRRFYCMALTRMDDRNVARGSIDGVWTTLTNLWSAASESTNGEALAMAVIGAGQSRLSQTLAPGDAIRLQALSFWLACRRERVCGELRIVMWPTDYDQLDHREIQSFLASLGKS